MKRKEDAAIIKLIEEEARRQFLESREDLRQRNREHIVKIQEENLKTYNLRRRKATTSKEGDLAAIKRPSLERE